MSAVSAPGFAPAGRPSLGPSSLGLLLALGLPACAPEPAGANLSGATSTGRVIEEGTPEALGVLNMLNDPSTTLTVLDIDAALDKRAATNLVAHRDGPDGRPSTADDPLFASIQQVDDVAWVGDAALRALRAHAQDTGWIPAGEDYYGTVETVSFTVAEAAAVVSLVNTASQTTLDGDVALDRRAAEALVAGRPYASLEEVAQARYVGASALTHLKSWVDAQPAPLSTAAALAALRTDVDGLWFSSESDYPLVVWQIEGPATTTITAANVQALLAPVYEARPEALSLADRTVEASSLGWLFDRTTVPQDWWEDSNRADAAQWSRVRADFETGLQDVSVWRLGPPSSFGYLIGDIDVFVIGRTADRDLVGIRTVSIET